MNCRVLLLIATAVVCAGQAACTTVVPVETVTVTVTPSAPLTPSALTPSAPTEQVFGQTDLQNGVTTILNETYKDTATNVSCPADEAVTVGNSFTCTASIGGETKQVQVTVKTSDGQYEVSEPQ